MIENTGALPQTVHGPQWIAHIDTANTRPAGGYVVLIYSPNSTAIAPRRILSPGLAKFSRRLRLTDPLGR